ncbi:DUF1488 family protein [Achromobacter sp. NPDC058515]|uniref:DUF1488 family protein n=1 Tax=Achromobacter sp. NPDC058515 TaxID=3346533 RepID=UPI00364771D6
MTTLQPPAVPGSSPGSSPAPSPTSSPFGRAQPRAPDATPGALPEHSPGHADATAEATGVRFKLNLAGKECAAVITAKALVEHFGARAGSAGLLACYRQHSSAIHRLAARKNASTLDGGVLISAADFSAEDASASPAGWRRLPAAL